MTGIGIMGFEALYASVPDARCKMRVNKRDVIARVYCTGIELERDSTETGLHNQQQGTIRFLLSDEPSKGIKNGGLVEIKTPGMTKYLTCRVNVRNDFGGAARLEVEEQFSE